MKKKTTTQRKKKVTKYYWLTGMYYDGSQPKPEEAVTTAHPFVYKSQAGEFVLFNWREITKQEYDQYKKLFKDSV